jgi:hypothetical protein
MKACGWGVQCCGGSPAGCYQPGELAPDQQHPGYWKPQPKTSARRAGMPQAKPWNTGTVTSVVRPGEYVFMDKPVWRPDQTSVASAAASLMAVIDARGGNPHWPHGGDAFHEALWNLCNQLVSAAPASPAPHGCICPPTSERTCQGLGCPRRAVSSGG